MEFLASALGGGCAPWPWAALHALPDSNEKLPLAKIIIGATRSVADQQADHADDGQDGAPAEPAAGTPDHDWPCDWYSMPLTCQFVPPPVTVTA